MRTLDRVLDLAECDRRYFEQAWRAFMREIGWDGRGVRCRIDDNRGAPYR